jgi:hypothetical protein
VFREPAPLNINSVGLLQLSLSDVKNYKAEHLGITSEEDLKDPIKNLQLGLLIMSKLHQKHPTLNVYQVGGKYWSALRWNIYWPGKRQDGFERFRKALGQQLSPIEPQPAQESDLANQIIAIIAADVDAKMRETHGKNRSPRIDSFNKRTGVPMGSPYCMAGAWCALDDACRKLGLKNPVPPTASSQGFFNNAPSKYRHTDMLGAIPIAAFGVMQQKSNSSRGHIWVNKASKKSGSKTISTLEYNTGPDGGRDGDGAYAKIRKVDGTSTLRQRGWVDVVAWVLDANK